MCVLGCCVCVLLPLFLFFGCVLFFLFQGFTETDDIEREKQNIDFRFTFVQDPIERALDAWFYTMKNQKQSQNILENSNKYDNNDIESFKNFLTNIKQSVNNQWLQTKDESGIYDIKLCHCSLFFFFVCCVLICSCLSLFLKKQLFVRGS